MALPKRRHSKTRGRLRRTGDALKKNVLVLCSECGAPIMPHRACPKCGTFNKKRDAIKTKTKKKKSE